MAKQPTSELVTQARKLAPGIIGPHGGNSVHARQILRRYGYNVRAQGDWTPRLHNAWQHYLNNSRTVGGLSASRAAHNWNQTKLGRQLADQHRTAGGNVSSMHGGAYRGSGGPSSAFVKEHGGYNKGKRPPNTLGGAVPKPHVDPKVKAHNQARTHAAAATHAKALGAGGHKVGGSGVPGIAPAGVNVNQLTPKGYAEQIAGQQYDPQIHEALAQQAQAKADTSQNVADISGWYKQVQDSLAHAAAQDAAAGSQTQAQVNNDIQGILQSLGGSRGAGVVGASGVNALASLAQQASGQNALNAQLAPIFQAEQAAASARESALGSQSQAKLADQLISLRGARGQALNAAQAQIMAQNNAARQQNFSNRLAVQNANLAAQSLGLNAANTRSTIAARNASTAYQYASLAERQAEFKAQLAGQKAAVRSKLGGGGWASLPGQSKLAAINSALGFAIKTHSKGGKTDWKAVQNTSLAYLRGAGFHSARKMGYRGNVPSAQARNDINNLLNLQIKARQG